jgi:hypothetical protein
MIIEKHYTPSELAKLWAVSPETIRSLFRERARRLENWEKSHKGLQRLQNASNT